MVLVVGVGLATLLVLLRQEPDFYTEAAIAPGEQRQRDAAYFQNEIFDLYQNRIRTEDQWETHFTDRQVNSWLAEDFVSAGLDKQLPPEISDPRVAFEPGMIKLAFRYSEAGIAAVVSIEAKVWISPSESNVLAVEVVNLRAGALPLSARFVQEHVTEWVRQQNIDLQWYRNEGNPVALLRFQADKREPTFDFEQLDLQQGSLFIKGKARNSETQAALLK
jgi:hypothetical protein